ncbi:MAG TPA: Crp/Fnr family transcriptional regulator [Xanthobacteraceae bacterium]|nr:Crp/Fnr family transcriptional regulator [Xanthobacteraceae bacterium]
MLKTLAEARNHLLASLPEPEFALLQPHLKDVPLKQGTVLCEQGELIDQVYFPDSGMVSIVVVLSDGEKSVETATVGREGAVGAVAGLGERKSTARAIVQVAGKGQRLPARHLQFAAKQSPVLRDFIVRYQEMLLHQAQQSTACNALHEARPRLCRWLLQTRDRLDSDMVALTQEFLAQMLGVRRTTVTELARGLQSKGLVRYKRGKIEILDRPGLEACACECYDALRHQAEHYFPHRPAHTAIP